MLFFTKETGRQGKVYEVRRCKTNFDYDTYYGICPKCAAYNRPDGKDEMKVGENAGGFEERIAAD